MALSDDVQARVPSQVLIEMTNPRGGTAPTSINSTKLTQACSSIQAYFERDAEEVYDGNVPIHLEVAVNGVLSLLRMWADGLYTATGEFWTAFRDECGRVKATRSRARMVPANNSELTPSDENPNGEEVRPWSDPSLFSGLHTYRPGGDPWERL